MSFACPDLTLPCLAMLAHRCLSPSAMTLVNVVGERLLIIMIDANPAGGSVEAAAEAAGKGDAAWSWSDPYVGWNSRRPERFDS